MEEMEEIIKKRKKIIEKALNESELLCNLGDLLIYQMKVSLSELKNSLGGPGKIINIPKKRVFLKSYYIYPPFEGVIKIKNFLLFEKKESFVIKDRNAPFRKIILPPGSYIFFSQRIK